ncbi:MAG: amino acid ABC transporter substrate-binding protein, partial [Methylibium sp.]|nr:amino acid ABC transporter substrate-binding protein [Methylibium sp.]
MHSPKIFVLSLLMTGIGAGVQAQTLDKLKSSGSISVGYREASIPFSYLGS